MYLINYRLFRYFNAKNIGYFFGNCLMYFDIDIYTFRKQNAAALASPINKKITEDVADHLGYYDHYHARPTCEAHFFFGFPKMV